jgi:hypothetical protein
MFWLKSSAVNIPGATRGQPGINLRSTCTALPGWTSVKSSESPSSCIICLGPGATHSCLLLLSRMKESISPSISPHLSLISPSCSCTLFDTNPADPSQFITVSVTIEPTLGDSPPGTHGVAAQVEFESKTIAKLTAVYHILVSSALLQALSTHVSSVQTCTASPRHPRVQFHRRQSCQPPLCSGAS